MLHRCICLYSDGWVYVLFVCMFVVFFKQKTAYEMRISDWSSDVCSSDLLATQSFADLVGSLILSLYPKLPKQNIDAQLVANGLVGSTVYLVMHWAFHDFAEPLDKILEHCVLFYDAASAEAERLAARHR